MFRKIVALLAVFAFMTCGCAMAEAFDISYIYENADFYEVSIEDGSAFVVSVLSAEARSFVHKYESTARYSSTQFDILVVDYEQEGEYPIFRMWITYCEDDEFKNFDSVTFDINGVEYTFEDIGSDEWKQYDENGYTEYMLIKFNLDNIDFLVALENLIPAEYEGLELISIPMTLHGDEDITVELGSGFMLDFIMLRQAALNTNTTDHFDNDIGNPMIIKIAE